jgi:hypothetical protein
MGYASKCSSNLGEILSAVSTLYGLATFNAITSLLLHRNEPNKVDSERKREDKEVGLIPSLLARFVQKW